MRGRWALIGGLLLALVGGPVVAGAVVPAQAAAASEDSLIMVLDSSGSMAGQRMAAAKKAVDEVVDTLPDGYPTGLRVYGAGKTHGCDDTSLVEPVQPLDRAAVKRAVAAVEPKGDTPIGLSLRKAAGDLPEGGRGTVLLVSDGEDNCGDPGPCEVAKQLADSAGNAVGLRIDTVGFQVRGKARTQLECIAGAGHGSYYDAPDAAALARQLERASRLSADAYKAEGEQVTGGASAGRAAALRTGQYVDTIGPGETRWYAAGLDAVSAADLAVTAVPPTGAKVAYGDGIELRLQTASGYAYTCDSGYAHFGQEEGAMVLSTAVSRVPSAKGGGSCDKKGRYLLSVHRTSDAGSDRGRWTLELRYANEAPLASGATPAPAETVYGLSPAAVTGEPKDVAGGTGFNDATTVTKGVWRDKLLPGQTRFYKVRVGWGQRLGYTAEFANEPVLKGTSSADWSFVRTGAYAPQRLPVRDASGSSEQRTYFGKPLSVGLGTVAVTWTNRWVSGGAAPAVHSAGDYYIAVSLGPGAARLAENAAVGVVLRVSVTGTELAGPQYKAPAASGSGTDRSGSSSAVGDSVKTGDTAVGDGGGSVTGSDLIAAGTGGMVALAGLAVTAAVRRRTRGGA
ncbi:VWA domain-containing protein [Streptomyces sp. NPDC059373]